MDVDEDLPAELPLNVVVIKKKNDTVIDNPIARIFKPINIFEYKDPTIRFSIKEFYKSISYVKAYASRHNVDVTDMSLSVVVTKESAVVWQYVEVTKQENGIYSIGGFPFPIQIIDISELSKETNPFLKSLTTGLDEETLEWAIKEAHKRVGKEPHINVSAYVNAIAQANPERLQKVLIKNPNLEQVLEELGITTRQS